ncbi:predicted protein [Uncinocarpus reesii 1704]|uniref:Lysine-specific metallo-endopeptidase domain-containing protein n=1 Tax=Uncinocarpus reesii (strain UAMH 1704) TaxID=336963 RepID=C4JGQ7_UNCRE|nr:uncharacterized protein UREG_02569 [Uncinocarpus reesii 1704]EEP77720.1 predicted protein [Uncinocarpus reesii 1704]
MFSQSTLSGALMNAALAISFLSPHTSAKNTISHDPPDPSKDQIPAFPPLLDDINDVSVKYSRPTQLYGWKGCGDDEKKAIAEAYRDFQLLASQPDVFESIDWNHQAAKDFWGPVKGDGRVTDEKRKEIQEIFRSTERIYRNWWSMKPLSLPEPRALWIEVRCSGKDGNNDPEDICGDKNPKSECAKRPDGSKGGNPLHGEDRRLFAWSDLRGAYSQIMFCNKFFHNLPSMNKAIADGKKKSKEVQSNLETWDNRARVFFHEAAHISAFMNPQSEAPTVEDVQIEFKEDGKKVMNYAHGPYYAKLLRNWVHKDKGGLYTQRNADSYAFFALAKWIEKHIQRYPDLPTPGSKKPESEPLISGKRNGDHKKARHIRIDRREGEDGLLGKKELEYKDQKIKGFSTPGCPDVYRKITKNGDDKDPKLTCDNKSPSGIPRVYFTNPTPKSTTSKFCAVADKDKAKGITWKIATGIERKKEKRASLLSLWLFQSDLKPKSWELELKWEPKGKLENCNVNCKEAMETMFLEDCDGESTYSRSLDFASSSDMFDQAGKPGLAVSAHVDTGCGTYRYKFNNY